MLYSATIQLAHSASLLHDHRLYSTGLPLKHRHSVFPFSSFKFDLESIAKHLKHRRVLGVGYSSAIHKISHLWLKLVNQTFTAASTKPGPDHGPNHGPDHRPDFGPDQGNFKIQNSRLKIPN